MPALTRFFFRLPYTCRTPSQIIGWWESRRLPFNLAVGATGLVTLGAVNLIALLPPRPAPVPLVGSLVVAGVYGLLANVCYTGGWMTELFIRRRGNESLEPVGPALFRYGFVFSVGLTLFPIAVAAIAKVAGIAAAVLR